MNLGGWNQIGISSTGDSYVYSLPRLLQIGSSGTRSQASSS